MSASDTFDILFVCTGNICRSPMAQQLLTHRLRERLGDRADAFQVSSAGTWGLVDRPMEPDAVTTLGEAGITVTSFAARELAEQLVEDADLVLTMERAHRAAAVTMVPIAAGRTFTLREFARLAANVSEERLPEPAEPVKRARVLVDAARALRGTVRPEHPSEDDIPDPYRMDIERFRAAMRDIDACLVVLVDRLSGLDRAAPAQGE